jgi:hypothetical protein
MVILKSFPFGILLSITDKSIVSFQMTTPRYLMNCDMASQGGEAVFMHVSLFCTIVWYFAKKSPGSDDIWPPRPYSLSLEVICQWTGRLDRARNSRIWGPLRSIKVLTRNIYLLNVLSIDCNTSLESRRSSETTRSKVTIPIPVRMSWTASGSAPRSGNSYPAKSCLTWPKRRLSDGARSREYGEWGAVFLSFCSRKSKHIFPVWGYTLSAWMINFNRFYRPVFCAIPPMG